MEPTFEAIAELFGLSAQAVENSKARSGKVGTDADESDELGRQALNDGRYDEALEHFRRAIEQRGPDDIKSRIELAGTLEYGDEFPQAFRQYEKVLRLKGEVAEPHVGLSDLYRRYGRHQDAVAQLRKAIELEPFSAYHHIKLAETLRDSGNPKEALKAAAEAILINPEDSFYHYWIGDLQIQLGHNEDALDSLRAAVELSPGDDYLYLRVAIPFWRLGKKTEAIKAIRLASDLDPEKHIYHGLLQVLLDESDLSAEADLENDRAQQMDRFDIDNLNRVLREMGLEDLS